MSFICGCKAAARFITQSLPPVLAGRAADALPFGGVELGALVAEVEAGRLSGAAAKEVLARMADQGGHPRDYMVAQVSDAGALDALVADALAKHPDKAAEYRGGRKGLLGFFVGAVVKASGGSANPQVVKQLVEKRLS